MIEKSLLTKANIKSSHIYLSKIISFFPNDAIGGTNKSESAAKCIRVCFVPGLEIETDIAGDKKFLRNRSATKDFFKKSGARAGDQVLIERISPYEFNFSLEKRP